MFLKPRVVPFAIREEVSNALRDLEKLGIIDKTDQVEWGTLIIPVFKKGRRI